MEDAQTNFDRGSSRQGCLAKAPRETPFGSFLKKVFVPGDVCCMTGSGANVRIGDQAERMNAITIPKSAIVLLCFGAFGTLASSLQPSPSIRYR